MITSLRLTDFRNFADETLALGLFTVIVGENASGKSNIRDAFRVLHGIGRGYSLDEAICGRHGIDGQVEWSGVRGAPNEIVRFGEDSMGLGICVQFDGEAEPHDFRYEIRARNDGDNGFVVLQESPSRNAVPDELLDALQAMRFPSPPRRRSARSLGDAGDDLPTVLCRICADDGRRETLLEWLRELASMDLASLRFPADPNTGHMQVVFEERSGRRMSPAQLPTACCGFSMPWLSCLTTTRRGFASSRTLTRAFIRHGCRCW